MMPEHIYKCQLCGMTDTDQDVMRKHVSDVHSKQLSEFKIKALRKSATSTEDQMNLADAIKEHTLKFLMDESDTKGVYSIDEVLGDTTLYQLFHNAATCGWKGCIHDSPSPEAIDNALKAIPK
jgi:hypothetical protein